MTKTCGGSGGGEGWGAALGDGSATLDTEVGSSGVGAGCNPAVDRVHAAMTMSVLRMAAARWAVEIRPGRGGRITSLRLDGDELLEQGIGVDQPTAEGFVEAGASGWDEMVPNLEATDALPDHGEAWRLPWEVLPNGHMLCRGRLVPWELDRSIALADSVKVDYVYRNVGHEPHRAFWCAHPLFRYEPEMEVSVDIPRPEEGRSAKVFLPRGSIDRVRLGRVEISWDASVTPDVAVWVCNGDLGGYRQIAVEPATASPMLEPGGSLTWGLRIRAL